MTWQNKIISPKRDTPPKVQIRCPCPGLFRFAGMMSFLVVSLGLYYGGTWLFGLKRLDWGAPEWTAKHIVLISASVLLGMLAGLLGAAFAATIEVRNERLNDLFIILWQFLANGSLIWIVTIGLAMSITLGREEAKAAVLHFGAERATLYVAGSGCIVALLSGTAYFLTRAFRLPLFIYFTFTIAVALCAARWLFNSYGIEGNSWIAAAVAMTIQLQLIAPIMIRRDLQQRRLIMERSSTYSEK